MLKTRALAYIAVLAILVYFVMQELTGLRCR